MARTLNEIETRLLATMPRESPIDLRAHAHAIAYVVIEARKQKVATTQEKVTEVREHSENMGRLIQVLRDQLRDREEAMLPGGGWFAS